MSSAETEAILAELRTVNQRLDALAAEVRAGKRRRVDANGGTADADTNPRPEDYANASRRIRRARRR